MILFILYGLIICLLVFIKYHVDLKFIHDKRKWYEKIRFILPIFLLPIFFGIYYFWNHYPEQLIKKDTQIEKAANPNSEISSWPISTTIIYSPSQDIEEPKTKFQEIGEKYGTYGDTYGSLNTLFTGFAFAGLIISIFIQLLELRQTRKELANQSKAMADQKTEFSAQTKILEKQADINANQQKIIDAQFKETQRTNFLNHFFKLMDQRNLLLNALIMPKEDKFISGHAVFAECLPKFREIAKEYDSKEHDREYFSKSWKIFMIERYGSINYQLLTYFKIYRVIFLTIQHSKSITDAEKKYYIEVFKMSITLEELSALMWISISDKNLNNLCNQFTLMNGLHHKNFEEIGVRFFKYEAFKSPMWKAAFKEYEKD